MKTILIVDDNELTLIYLSSLLASKYKILTAQTQLDCQRLLKSHAVHMVLLDLCMPEVDYFDSLIDIKTRFPLMPIIIVTSDENPNVIVKCLKMGAKHYVFKNKINDSPQYFYNIIDEVFEESALTREKAFISKSTFPVPIPSREYDLAVKSVRGGLHLVINGETGTGKSFLVSQLHKETAPKSPLISINCAAICEQLVDSELFGYEKGSFTGAVSTEIGKIEAANGGILFLDELGKLPLYVQEKLLTVIETKQFFRIGGTSPIHVDFLLISASNICLETLVEKGLFLKDLFYRIQQFVITLPSLRHSTEYILSLTHYFITIFNQEYQCDFKLNKDLNQWLLSHSWDGNIRELKNKLQTLVAMYSQGESLDLGYYKVDQTHFNLSEDVNSYEKNRLLAVLKECHFNLSKAARSLDIPRSTLQGKLRKYQITYTK